MQSATPCYVCGELTFGSLGVCNRTAACRSEIQRRKRALKGMKTRQYKPCLICGRPTDGQYQICARTPECQSAAHQARVEAQGKPPRTPCTVCGAPTRSASGACNKTPACRTAQHQYRYQTKKAKKPARPPCELCGQPTSSAYGVCGRTKACRREQHLRLGRARAEETNRHRREWGAAHPDEYRELNNLKSQRYRTAHPEANRATQQKVQQRYLQRTDRRCRRWRAGCPEPAAIGSYECDAHTKASQARREERNALRSRLATGTCTWCTEELLLDADAHIDHIIPVALGGPDEEWNYQLLHRFCNLAKRDTLTPAAIKLANEHGITLDPESVRKVA